MRVCEWGGGDRLASGLPTGSPRKWEQGNLSNSAPPPLTTNFVQ